MTLSFHDGHRQVQDRFDARRLADKLGGVAGEQFDERTKAFVEALDMFFLATTDTDGFPDCSYKGGEPGFVKVVDANTLAFPVYDGNGMFRSLGNITVNPRVGMLFVDLEGGSRLRVNGTAQIAYEGPLVDSFAGAIAVVTVEAQAIFANCRRYVHEYRKVTPSPFVPATDGEPVPVPDWKRDPWFDGTLPEGDPALDPSRPSAPAIPHF